MDVELAIRTAVRQDYDMNTAQFERRDGTILDLDTHQKTKHKSINAAKRWSRKKQLELEGVLGMGSVRAAT